jgi:hypothetical protein
MPYLLHRSMSLALLQDVSSLNLAVLFAPPFFCSPRRMCKKRRSAGLAPLSGHGIVISEHAHPRGGGRKARANAMETICRSLAAA